MTLFQYNEDIIILIYIYICIYIYAPNIIHYLFLLTHAYPLKISTIFILKYYSDEITHKKYTFIKMLYLITMHTYYVGFISICNGIIGADAVGLPVLFTDCAKVIASSECLHILGMIEVMVLHRFDPIIVLLG